MNAGRRQETSVLRHPFAPVFDARSRALVLGSFPSVKSRENEFYYGHPRNRFWLVLAALLKARVPETIAEKTDFLHRYHLALWDVVASCTISGSADSTLTPLKLNDIDFLLKGTDIHLIFANGQKAGRLLEAHLEKAVGIPIVILPSTSPANAAWSLERLIAGWKPLCDTVKTTARPEEQHL